MKLNHEILQGNYQKAVEYVKTHYADITIIGGYGENQRWMAFSPFDNLTLMEKEIKGDLFCTIENGNLLLGRAVNEGRLSTDYVIKIIDRPTDIDIVHFLGKGWQELRKMCESILDNYHFATNFNPSKSRE